MRRRYLECFSLDIVDSEIGQDINRGKESSDENTQSQGESMLLGERESNNYLHVSLIYQFVQCKKYLVSNLCLGWDSLLRMDSQYGRG